MLILAGLVTLAGTCIGPALMGPFGNVGAQSLQPVASDSVVRLGYNPEKVRGSSLAVLLDESVLRVEDDGKWRRNVRQVVQVFDANGVRAVAERSLSYVRGQQNLTLRWARVLRLNGEVVSDKPALEQDADVPAAINNPIYQNQRVRRFSLAGVAANTIVDVAYSIEVESSPRPGDFFAYSTLNGPLPVRHSLFTLDVPSGYSPHIVEHNLVARREEGVAGGRHTFRWSANEQLPISGEPFAADSNGIVQSVGVSAAGDWSGMASWYNNLARDRYVVSARVARVADSVVAASAPRNRLDSLQAWHKWVTQDIRYVSVSLGIGGYQPRSPDEVLATGFGDCKDKATLFVAVLRRAGIEAEPVILSLSRKPDRGLPSVFQFDHAIAAVREGNQWRFTDLTADIYPYGEIPEAYQGSFAVQVTTDGMAREITLPVSPVEANSMTVQLITQLDSAGNVRGHATESATGALAPALRALLVSVESESRRTAVVQGLARRLIGTDAGMGSTVDSLRGTHGRNMATHPQQEYETVITGAIRAIGSSRALRVPSLFRSPANRSRSLLSRIDTTRLRLMPIDAARVVGPAVITQEWRVTLPDGWTVELPRSVTFTAFFGSYKSTWSLAGQEVRLVRELRGARGVYGPERLPELKVWAEAVIADDVEFLTLKTDQKH